MPEPEKTGHSAKDKYMTNAVAKVLSPKDGVLLKPTAPIEKEPNLFGRVRRDKWRENGPPNVDPPSKRYYFKNGGKDQSWETVAAEINRPPEWLVRYNFRLVSPYDPAEVNWFLREYVGAKTPTSDNKNWTFETTDLGYIYVPKTLDERLPAIESYHDLIVARMESLEKEFKFSEFKRAFVGRWVTLPPFPELTEEFKYLNASYGFAETMRALIRIGDYAATRGLKWTDDGQPELIIEEPEEFPNPPGTDPLNYRPQGYRIGYRAALSFWDTIPKDMQLELQRKKGEELIDRLYNLLQAKISQLMGTTVQLPPRGYPPAPRER